MKKLGIFVAGGVVGGMAASAITTVAIGKLFREEVKEAVTSRVARGVDSTIGAFEKKVFGEARSRRYTYSSFSKERRTTS
jgi:transposase-like protein